MAEALARGTREVVQSMYGVLVPPEQAQQQAHRQDSEESGSQPEYNMAPPPDMAFDSREKLLDYLKNWAASQGYAVVIGRSRTNRLWIRCDRGGLYHDKHHDDPSQRQRKRKVSRLTGCEFSVKASMRKDGIWRSRTETGDHNHGPSEDLRDHPSLRRMNEEQLQYVYELTEQGMTPADIMTELTRRWPDIKVIRRDIYNARKNYKTIKEATDQPPREFEDPNGRMPGPTDNGRWAWVEDGDEIKKKRRVGRPPKEREPAATALQNISGSQLSAGAVSDDPWSASVSRPVSNPVHVPNASSSWNRLSTAASASQSPALSSQASAFQPPPTTSNMPVANRLRSPRNESGNHSSSHIHSNNSSMFNFGTLNPPTFPQQILTPTVSNDSNGIPSNASSSVANRHPQRQQSQSHIHPSLRTPQGPSGNNSPVTPRQESSVQLANQLHSHLEPSSQRSATDQLAAANALSGVSPGQAKPSGAAMIQRMSRLEEEVRDQKIELRDQKNMLAEILAAVHSLKGGVAGV